MPGFGAFASGLALSAVCLIPIVLAARALRAWLVPECSGAGAVVAGAVLALGLLTLALTITGALGLLTRAGVVIACPALAGVGLIVARRRHGRRQAIALKAPAPVSTVARVAAVSAVALVGAAWLGWTYQAYRQGPLWVDTLWYHLPAAARFVQQGSIGALHYFDSEAITVFYPFNSELLHAFGLLMFSTDVLTPALNLGWAALALTAGWAIGRPYGRSPHCLLAVAIVLGTPGLVDTQPGGALNDVVCVALPLCIAAILVHGRPGPHAGAVAAIAGGLALGTKFTMIVPVVALGIGAVAVWDRRSRGRQTLVWVLALLVWGGYWYLRNLVEVGNPLPSLSVHLGPLSLASPRTQTPSFTVAQYLTDSSVWKAFFFPGLRRSLGLAWPVLVIVFWAGGAMLLVRARDRMRRMLAAVALVAMVAFLVSPQALGLPGVPAFFVNNVRYAAPALALGLVLVATLPWPRIRAADTWLALAGLTLAVTALDPGVWPSGIGVAPFDTPVHGAAARFGVAAGIVVLVAGLVRPRAAPGRRAGAAALAVVLAVLFGGGWALAHSYESRRYAQTAPLPAVYRWARPQRDLRIGIVGFTEQYPLYGLRAENVVQYIGAARAHRGYADIAGCRAWRRAVTRGRYRWLVIAPPGFPLGHGTGPQLAWTLAGGHAHVVLAESPVDVALPDQRVALVRITGPLDAASCP